MRRWYVIKTMDTMLGFRGVAMDNGYHIIKLLLYGIEK